MIELKRCELGGNTQLLQPSEVDFMQIQRWVMSFLELCVDEYWLCFGWVLTELLQLRHLMMTEYQNCLY